MKIAIIGGTGFVGGYVVDALLAAGHEVHVLVRPGSEAKLRQREACTLHRGDLRDKAALKGLIDGADAVFYSVGLLREFPSRGITYEETQYEGVRRCVDLAREAGVQRFLLMSANGVRAGGTAYQDTKQRADDYLRNSSLNGSVFQPSVVFGDPQGKVEFATQLHRDMIRPPLPAIAFHNGFSAKRGAIKMSPVHVTDLAAAVVMSLESDRLDNRTLVIGGPEALSFAAMLERIAAAVGKRKIILPMPISVMRVAATLLDWLPPFPVTRDQLQMLSEGNVASGDELAELTGRELIAFDGDGLGYLNQPRQERAR